MTSPKIKAVLFDFMGTCLDWHRGVVETFPSPITEDERSQLALEWRQDYFDSNDARRNAGQPPEDIDITLERTLDALLQKHPRYQNLFTAEIKAASIRIWHSMPAWQDVPKAISQVQVAGYQTFVHANGTTRLQLDLCRSSGLHFDMLFSSELLQVYKPARESYEKVLQLLKFQPHETVMVAAHAYDLRGAKDAGMRTVYIRRWTDDIREDMDSVRKEFEYFLEDMTRLPEVIGAL